MTLWTYGATSSALVNSQIHSFSNTLPWHSNFHFFPQSRWEMHLQPQTPSTSFKVISIWTCPLMSFLNSQRKRCSLPILVLLVSFMAKTFLHWSTLLYFQLFLLHWCFLNSILNLTKLFNILILRRSLATRFFLCLTFRSQTACSLPPRPSISFIAWPSAIRLCHHNFIGNYLGI